MLYATKNWWYQVLTNYLSFAPTLTFSDTYQATRERNKTLNYTYGRVGTGVGVLLIGKTRSCAA